MVKAPDAKTHFYFEPLTFLTLDITASMSNLSIGSAMEEDMGEDDMLETKRQPKLIYCFINGIVDLYLIVGSHSLTITPHILSGCLYKFNVGLSSCLPYII